MTNDRIPPRIDNAPGLVWKPRKDGWEARWQARTDLVKRGYQPKSARLWAGQEPSEIDRALISDECNRLQSEMLVWGRGGVPTVLGVFDGSLKSLIACYLNDPDSNYHNLRFATRNNYDARCRRLEHAHGTELISTIKARQLLRWHEEWTAGDKIAMGHSMVAMLRTLAGFGATILEDAECERLSGVLHRMKFKMAKPRNEWITAGQAIAVRAAAHAMGLPSVALAQAFQFEGMLRQKDVIGEWVPQSEPGTSDVITRTEKWLRGLRWSEIDANMILRHTTSKRQKDIEIDLKLAPMVMEEFDRLGGIPTAGPIIVYEGTALPFRTAHFRRVWREVADAAGIPKAVKNMDSRAGAISEATNAGASLELVRHAATHSNVSTTANYSRGTAEKTANVMQLRAAHRNKK